MREAAGAWRWREYAMDGACLGLFMVSACSFAVLLEHPGSPVHRSLPDSTLRRTLMGLAMGLTAVALIHSPWGRRSGAHMNPGVTLAFARLGHVNRRDAIGYTAGQFLGGALAIAILGVFFGSVLAAPQVRFVVTEPGALGVLAAFAAELAISFVLLLAVLTMAASPKLAPHIGAAVGALLALFITFEAPISGTSMNPARSLASALGAGAWQHLWIYFVAPPLGMQLAAWVHACAGKRGECAKLDHRAEDDCHFCGKRAVRAEAPVGAERNLPRSAGVSTSDGDGMGAGAGANGGQTR